MRHLRTRTQPPPPPPKVVPITPQVELQARALVDCYLLDVPLDFSSLVMPSLLPSLLAHADLLARELADRSAEDRPTAEAYAAACAAIEKHRTRAAELQVQVDALARELAAARTSAASAPAANRSEADDLRALLREADTVWKDGTCDVVPDARPPGCACLGCRIHRAIQEG